MLGSNLFHQLLFTQKLYWLALDRLGLLALLPYPQYFGYSEEEMRFMQDRESTAWNYHRFTAAISRKEVRIQFFPQAEFLYSSVSSGCQSSKPRMSNPAASSRLT